MIDGADEIKSIDRKWLRKPTKCWQERLRNRRIENGFHAFREKNAFAAGDKAIHRAGDGCTAASQAVNSLYAPGRAIRNCETAAKRRVSDSCTTRVRRTSHAYSGERNDRLRLGASDEVSARDSTMRILTRPANLKVMTPRCAINSWQEWSSWRLRNRIGRDDRQNSADASERTCAAVTCS